MNLLQVKIDDHLKKAIKEKADTYGVPSSTLVRIVLVKTFLEDHGADNSPGNIFNAERDNKGTGIKLDDFLTAL